MSCWRWAFRRLIGILGLVDSRDWPVEALLGLGALAAAIAPLRAVHAGAAGGALVPVLVATGRLLLVYGILLAAGIAVGALTHLRHASPNRSAIHGPGRAGRLGSQ